MPSQCLLQTFLPRRRWVGSPLSRQAQFDLQRTLKSINHRLNRRGLPNQLPPTLPYLMHLTANIWHQSSSSASLEAEVFPIRARGDDSNPLLHANDSHHPQQKTRAPIRLRPTDGDRIPFSVSSRTHKDRFPSRRVSLRCEDLQGRRGQLVNPADRTRTGPAPAGSRCR